MQYQFTLSALLLMLLILLSPSIASTNNPWQTINEDQIDKSNLNRQIIPNEYMTFHLEMDHLQLLLSEAPLRFTPESHKNEVVLQIPMPNGQMEYFQIMEAPIMHPALSRKYPMLHSYTGVGIDDPTASIRFDITPMGFHAMILSGRHGGVFIDPYAKGDTKHYIVYYQKDFYKDVQYQCHFEDDNHLQSSIMSGNSGNGQVDGMLRTYRLALACTGEYTVFHGGTKADAMAAFHTTMTRVNGIYEREVAINLELIENTDDLIFLDGTSDPYNFESPIENQAVCDEIIGSDNYDLGHVFGVGSGGAAFRSSCCVEGIKADAYSTLSTPVGDPFDINFVSHEFGHQFGCSHTYSATCNSTKATSVEPGNAYSIMGTDFFCNQIESVRGAYFHSINILEISQNVTNGLAGSCATLTTTGNTPPTVDGGDELYIVPISTPFKLTAEGTESNGDILTYCWEQMDNEEGIDPPISTNTVGPAFRSYEPVEEPYRYFPAIENVINGTNSTWEVLPSVSRLMNFRVTARDNFSGGGLTAYDDIDLTFTANAGPFLVQQPNENEIWYQNAWYPVSWDVANTDKFPVSCANVDILLSLDGGYTYPIVLASEVPNDGKQIIFIPEVSTSTARIMVACSDNIFFDICDENFSIEPATAPDLSLVIDPIQQEVCGPVENGEYILFFNSLAGFNEEISLTTTGLPDNATLIFSQNPVIPPASVNLTINGLENVNPGEYTISVVGTTASTSVEEDIVIRVDNNLPGMINLITPLNGATNEPLNPTFSWEVANNTASYTFEIAPTPAFGKRLTEAVSVNNNSYTLSKELEPLSVYYWRIIPENVCVEEVPFFAFQTTGNACKQFTNVQPTYIYGFVHTASTTITIEKDFHLLDANISMEIFHKQVGDLKAILTAPSGTSVELFDRPGVPNFPFGCSRDDLLLTLDDEASNTADELENTCISGTDYAIEGTFQPITPLSDLSDQSTQGDWILTIADERFSRAGAIDNWSLEFCFEAFAGESLDFSKMNVQAPGLGIKDISMENLLATSSNSIAEQITYTLLSLPTEGVLILNGLNLGIGATFTQEEINNNLLQYINTNPDSPLDQFTFDIQSVDGSWIRNESLDISIGEITNLEQSTNDFHFDLFPNPSSGSATLLLKQPTSSPFNLVIFDSLGKMVKEIDIEKVDNSFQHQIDLHNLPSGIYFLYLTNGKSFYRKIFIKS
jgi:subtilisin-like proprotein convertase family protein